MNATEGYDNNRYNILSESVIEDVRGDGSCYYRAYLNGLLYLIMNEKISNYLDEENIDLLNKFNNLGKDDGNEKTPGKNSVTQVGVYIFKKYMKQFYDSYYKNETEGDEDKEGEGKEGKPNKMINVDYIMKDTNFLQGWKHGTGELSFILKDLFGIPTRLFKIQYLTMNYFFKGFLITVKNQQKYPARFNNKAR